MCILKGFSRFVVSFDVQFEFEFDGRVEFVSLFNKLIHVFFYHCPRGRSHRQYIVSILFRGGFRGVWGRGGEATAAPPFSSSDFFKIKIYNNFIIL